jgi:F-type H+-transporting ATPase subunit alpha
VPTNVISITDGQIFLDTDLFNAGVRPAINAGLSVSRVGGAAQSKIIKKLGIGVRLMLAQYRELASFAQFASELDKVTSTQLERGQRVTELTKQKQYKPISVALMSISLFAAYNGDLDDVPIKKIEEFEKELHDYVKINYKDLLKELDVKQNLDDSIAEQIKILISHFKQSQFANLE